MRVISLASGSKGNAYLVGDDTGWLLIDNGLGHRTFCQRLGAVGVAMETLRGVLITHSHSDHVLGLRPMLDRHPMPMFANSMTAEVVCEKYETKASEFFCFENAQTFELAGFMVSPFSVPHDTSDPVGYLISKDGETYFHSTDVGAPTDFVGLKLREADLATLEANHDPVLLRNSNRPQTLIQRIAGQRGHLANHEAAELVRKFASPKLKRLGLAHLSQDCNAPHLAEGELQRQLEEMHRTDVTLKVYSQHEVVEL